MKGVQIVEPSFCLAVFCSAMAGDAECRPAKRRSGTADMPIWDRLAWGGMAVPIPAAWNRRL